MKVINHLLSIQRINPIYPITKYPISLTELTELENKIPTLEGWDFHLKMEPIYDSFIIIARNSQFASEDIEECNPSITMEFYLSENIEFPLGTTGLGNHTEEEINKVRTHLSSWLKSEHSELVKEN